MIYTFRLRNQMEVHFFEVDRKGDRTTGLPIDKVYNQCKPESSYLYDIIRYERDAVRAGLKGETHPLIGKNVDKDVIYVQRTRLSYDECLLSEDSLYDKVSCYMVLNGSKYMAHVLVYHTDDSLSFRDLVLSLGISREPNIADVVRELVIRIVGDSCDKHALSMDIDNSYLSKIITSMHSAAYKQ